MASPPMLYDNELDRLLARMFRTTSTRRPWPPLGWGFGHYAGIIKARGSAFRPPDSGGQVGPLKSLSGAAVEARRRSSDAPSILPHG